LKNHFDIAREELAFYGTECTSLQNFLAILIGPKADPTITGRLAALGIEQLSELSIEELKQFEGIGEIAAQRIVSAFGLANYIRKYQKNHYIIRETKDAAYYFRDLEYLKQEYFEAIYLNTKNAVIRRKNIFKGTLNASIVHPREVFKEGIRLSASAVIVAHNHPSGDPIPSSEDIEVTKRLVEAGRITGIELLDHIIIGSSGRFASLREKRYDLF
jgi:DNA repair protein RadC